MSTILRKIQTQIKAQWIGIIKWILIIKCMSILQYLSNYFQQAISTGFISYHNLEQPSISLHKCMRVLRFLVNMIRKRTMTATLLSQSNIVTFVPAHNEANVIRTTIESLLSQTYKVDIVVINDNSTDDTASIVKSIAATNSRVTLTETVDNKFKKSGALNAAFRTINLEPYNYVLSVDADTVVAPDLIEQALIEFQFDPQLGAVCSRAGVVKQATKGFFEKLIYHWQYVEYAEFDRSRVGQDRRIKVAHGMCSMYKVEAIKDVMSKRKATGKLDSTVYDVHNITEDYELTITLKELGYHIAAGFGCMLGHLFH
jgi:poly-beta-1,6-N-acetyl-D-glucosamine synthase